MTLYFHDDLELVTASEELAKLTFQLLNLVSKKARRIDPAILREAAVALEESGTGVDEIEFIRTLASDLEKGQVDKASLQNLYYALQLMSAAEYRLRSLAKHQPPSPSAEA